MFGPLLGIVFQLFGELLIALPIGSSWARACNGTDGHFIILEAHQ